MTPQRTVAAGLAGEPEPRILADRTVPAIASDDRLFPVPRRQEPAVIAGLPTSPRPETMNACGPTPLSPRSEPSSRQPGQGGPAPDTSSSLKGALVAVVVGLLDLAIGGRFGAIARSHACQPRNPAGRDALRA
jgi:hypothetical protein